MKKIKADDDVRLSAYGDPVETQSVKEKELIEMIDGIYDIITLWNPSSEYNEKWKKNWLAKARKFGAGPF